MYQRTFVMIKPDGVQRGLIGEIISAIERTGLKITRMDMRRATPALVEKHYPSSEDWLRTAGEKSVEAYEASGLDIKAAMGTDDPLTIGKTVKQRLVSFICSGEVVPMIVEGNMAIANVRRLCGNTLPCNADPASIRGRFGNDSPDLSAAEQRPIMNLVHASGEPEEAEFEIKLWFGDEA